MSVIAARSGSRGEADEADEAEEAEEADEAEEDIWRSGGGREWEGAGGVGRGAELSSGSPAGAPAQRRRRARRVGRRSAPTTPRGPRCPGPAAPSPSPGRAASPGYAPNRAFTYRDSAVVDAVRNTNV
ncbi:hypothetical protein Sm713_60280 [Streptomyces sp. TS71-3]|nr:hypothetical protein Sm713_60280 [Streptomyces sp. TS71-3]